MRCSHCTGANFSRHSRSRPYARLTLENLESRTVLSAASALAASLASAGSVSATVLEEVRTLPREDVATPTLSAVASPAAARPTPVPWSAGLRSALASAALKPPSTASVGNEIQYSVSTLSMTATSSSTIDPRLQNLSPTSKYCRKYSSTLCNVPLDDTVDPIFSCPKIEDLFCLP